MFLTASIGWLFHFYSSSSTDGGKKTYSNFLTQRTFPQCLPCSVPSIAPGDRDTAVKKTNLLVYGAYILEGMIGNKQQTKNGYMICLIFINPLKRNQGE